MGDLPFLIKVSFTGLVVFQLIALALRFPSCESKGEAVGLALLLALLGARLVIPPDSPFAVALSVCLVWVGGELLITVMGEKTHLRWGLLNAFFLALLQLASLFEYRSTLSFIVFRGFFLGVFSLYPLLLLLRLLRRDKWVADGFIISAAILILLANGIQLVFAFFGRRIPDLEMWPVCLLIGVIGYLLFQAGYLLRDGRRRGKAELTGRVELMRAVYGRLLRTENALVLQDRLIVSGLLAMGAAHDFKNTLAYMTSTAQRALGQADPDFKDRGLRLLIQHADAGGKAAVEFLERLSREGREASQAIDVADCITRLVRLVRVSYRARGVTVRLDLPKGIRIFAHRGELEQALLNLTGNAAQSLARDDSAGEKLIDISCRSFEGSALIEVKDNAGGVSADAVGRLFQICPPADGGTGLGLYLSHSLIERNGGTLTYVALEGGSCFRITLPLAEDDAGQGSEIAP
jgi:signal transduction histidine kinase